MTLWEMHRMLDTANSLGLEQIPNPHPYPVEPRFSDSDGRVYTARELVEMAKVGDAVPRKEMNHATDVQEIGRDGTGVVRQSVRA